MHGLCLVVGQASYRFRRLQAIARRVQIVVDHLASVVDHVDARVTDCRGADVTRHRQQIVAHARQLTRDPERPVLLALRREFRFVVAEQEGPFLDLEV